MTQITKRAHAVIIAASVVLALGACATSPETACTVADKDRSSVTTEEGGLSTVYRVYTDCGVFNVEDALLLGKWNAADTYAGIEVGKTYEFTTYGFRNGLFSMFPNIIEARMEFGE